MRRGGSARPAPTQGDDACGLCAAIRFLLPLLQLWVKGREEFQTDQRTGEMEQSAEHVGMALVADTEAAAAEQPGERALDHPAVPPQPLAGLHTPTRNPRRDTAGAKGAAQG
jgi:hypothetical protein